MKTYTQRKDSVILSRGKDESFRPEARPGDIMIYKGTRFRLELKNGRSCEDCPFYDEKAIANWCCSLPRDVRNDWCTAYPPEKATCFVALDQDLPTLTSDR